MVDDLLPCLSNRQVQKNSPLSSHKCCLQKKQQVVIRFYKEKIHLTLFALRFHVIL